MENIESKIQIPTIPNNFKKIICDFTTDLTIVFPEYSIAWAKWNNDITDDELKNLFEYCLIFYPNRFFDILNKNEDIFSNDLDSNTLFLPNVEFKALYNCEGISIKTRENLWKYLQLILFSVVQSMDNSSLFGDSLNMFDSIDMKDIQIKLKETMNDMANMFDNNENNNEDNNENNNENNNEDNNEDNKNKTKSSPFDAENLHEHISSLLNGKIGSLAKELAEDVSREFNEDILQMNDSDITGNSAFDTKNILEKLMKNPSKIMDLVKNVGGKLDQKMKNGDISQEELMKEVSNIMGKMKNIPGMGDMNDLLKKMGQNFGGMAGAGAGGGAKAQIDTNAMNRAMKNQQMKDKLRARMEAKKMIQIKNALEVQNEIINANTIAFAESAADELIQESIMEKNAKEIQTQTQIKNKKSKKGKK